MRRASGSCTVEEACAQHSRHLGRSLECASCWLPEPAGRAGAAIHRRRNTPPAATVLLACPPPAQQRPARARLAQLAAASPRLAPSRLSLLSGGGRACAGETSNLKMPVPTQHGRRAWREQRPARPRPSHSAGSARRTTWVCSRCGRPAGAGSGRQPEGILCYRCHSQQGERRAPPSRRGRSRTPRRGPRTPPGTPPPERRSAPRSVEGRPPKTQPRVERRNSPRSPARQAKQVEARSVPRLPKTKKLKSIIVTVENVAPRSRSASSDSSRSPSRERSPTSERETSLTPKPSVLDRLGPATESDQASPVVKAPVHERLGKRPVAADETLTPDAAVQPVVGSNEPPKKRKTRRSKKPRPRRCFLCGARGHVSTDCLTTDLPEIGDLEEEILLGE